MERFRDPDFIDHYGRFREGNILPSVEPRMQTRSRKRFGSTTQNIRSIYGGDAGENLTDWPLGSFGIDDPALPSPARSTASSGRPSTPLAGDEH
jgi:hypothetical protein